MKNIVLRLPFFCLLLALSTGGMAQSRLRSLDVGKYTRIIVEADVDVTVRFVPDSAGLVTYECPDSLVSALIFDRTSPSKLKIQLSSNFLERRVKLPCVTVYADLLEEINSSSAGRVEVLDLPRVPSFKGVLMGNGTLEVSGIDVGKMTGVLATGAGTINLSGKCHEATLRLTGAGSIRGYDLVADKVSAQVLGGGEIFCYPLEKLVLTGVGSTRVYYRGKPAKIKKAGLGKIIPMDPQ